MLPHSNALPRDCTAERPARCLYIAGVVLILVFYVIWAWLNPSLWELALTGDCTDIMSLATVVFA